MIFSILAMQHGYHYKRIVAPHIPGYHSTWVKVVHLYRMLHEYDIVVFLDADVYVRNPKTSLEFLMKRYNFTDTSSLLMASDPNLNHNKDSKGRVTLNMGFIIVRSNNLTKHIFRELASCGDTISGCDNWKLNWSHEQRAFSEYFRDRFKVGSELIIGPCTEINGYDTSTTDCKGDFVLHVWAAKQTIPERLKKLMVNNLMSILEEKMWSDNHIFIAPTSDIQKLDEEKN